MNFLKDETYVGGYGNSMAKLMLVGEAPGKHEVEHKMPFVGPSGEIVNECLRYAGISRDDVYITNVVKVQPPGNDIRALHLLGYKIEDFLPQLWEEIDTIKPNCILALGNTALQALTGQNQIRKYRGSILPNARSVLPKVVPTIHPATLLHQEREMQNWKILMHIKFDFMRAAQQSLFRDLISPERTLMTAGNSLAVLRFMEMYKARSNVPLALDVETRRTIPLCIGLSFDPTLALSIPLLNHQTAQNEKGIPLHDQLYIWRLVAEFIGDNGIPIACHNAKFDQRILEDVGLDFKVTHDTMIYWHVLFPEMPKKLEFITSILTEEPYYKDEGREYDPKKDKLDRLLLYNAKDAAVTIEILHKELAMLDQLGLTEFAQENMKLHDLYYEIEAKGILIDEQARNRLKAKYAKQQAEVHADILKWAVTRVGNVDRLDVNVNSHQQVHKFLFQLLECPLRADTQESTLQALRNNAVKDEARRRVIQGILDERKIRKTISTYLQALPSED